jgi:2-polyprenyl-3-methyl-5-hydroxy-6-metoxy-1,4-benzoquinol methylase
MELPRTPFQARNLTWPVYFDNTSNRTAFEPSRLIAHSGSLWNNRKKQERFASLEKPMRQYDKLACDYHWLYSDHVLSGEFVIEENKDILSGIKQDMQILDCSCGIGTLALALAKRGLKVAGSDGSKGMTEQAIYAAATAGLNIPLICSTWEELPKHFADRFQIVFCLGNSICHCRNRDELMRSLKGMRSVLRNDGKLVIQSRNWEYLRQEKTRITHFQWRERGGQRCLPIYVWNFPESFDAEHTIEIMLVFDTDGQVSVRSYPISYYPFRFEQLAACLKSAGFGKLQDTFHPNKAEYRVIAS